MLRPPARNALLTLVLSAALAVPAGAVQVLIPRDRAVVEEDTLLVLGAAARGSVIPWAVAGPGGSDAGEARADWGDLFEVFLILDPGLNRLRVGEQEIEVFYAAGDAVAPAGFHRQSVHAGDISRCRDCHDLTDLSTLPGGYARVCLGCHVVVSSNPKFEGEPTQDAHFQTAVLDCGRCHEPHAGLAPKLLRGTSDELCGACHRPQLTGREAHPAYDEGGCAACHDPHFSGYPRTLHQPVPRLCQQCHGEGVEIGPGGRLHPPMADGSSCLRCHEPHGTTPGLLTGEPRALCLSCHASAATGGHGKAFRECVVCHDPHGSRGKGLLGGDVGPKCARCHERVGEGKTVHEALDEGCESCHDPHRDADAKKAWTTCRRCHDPKSDQQLRALHGDLSLAPETCARCHPPHASGEGQLVRARLHFPLTQGSCSVCHGGGEDRSTEIDDVAARCRMCHAFERDLRARGARIHSPVADGECTACHEPHMSNRKALLRAPEAETCRGCHDDPVGSKAVVHAALEEGCTGCHAPHGSAQPGFLVAAGNELCRQCHEIGGSHHTLDTTRTAKYPGAARFPQRGGELACIGCHVPHASDQALLFPSPRSELCAACHDASRVRR